MRYRRGKASSRMVAHSRDEIILAIIFINQDVGPHLRHLRDFRGGAQEAAQLGMTLNSVRYVEGHANCDDEGVNRGRSGHFSIL